MKDNPSKGTVAKGTIRRGAAGKKDNKWDGEKWVAISASSRTGAMNKNRATKGEMGNMGNRPGERAKAEAIKSASDAGERSASRKAAAKVSVKRTGAMNKNRASRGAMGR